MKARREMFSISDMTSLEWGEITLEDFACQSLAAHANRRRILRLNWRWRLRCWLRRRWRLYLLLFGRLTVRHWD